jgi:apoptosis-inducing factor 3
MIEAVRSYIRWKYHESQGVKFHLQANVDRIIASETDPTQAAAVQITSEDGTTETLEADCFIMGVGVAPATEFLKQSDGFPKEAIQRDGGIAVDEYLKVQGLEDVYAVGDIAFYPQLFNGENRRVEHWNVGGISCVAFRINVWHAVDNKVAGNHGRAVGKTIAGYPQPFVKVPVFWSARMFFVMVGT